jgi:hypothetical protein
MPRAALPIVGPDRERLTPFAVTTTSYAAAQKRGDRRHATF